MGNFQSDINIQFTFDKGLNEKADSKLTDGMLTLVNAQFEKAGSVKKRRGYTSLSTSFVSSSLTSSTSGTIATGSSLATYNNELILFGTSSVHTYSQAKNSWIYKNELYPATVTEVPIIANADRQIAANSTRTGSLRVVAWVDEQNNSVNASIQDVTTQTFYQSNAVLTYGGDGLSSVFGGPKVIPCGDYVYIFYLANREIHWRRIDVNDPYTFSAATILVPSSSITLNSTYNHYDVASWRNHPSGDSMLLTHVSGNTLFSKRISTSGAVVTTVSTSVLGTLRDVYFVVPMTASAQAAFAQSFAGQHYVDFIQYTTVGGLNYVTSSLGVLDFDDVSGGVGTKCCGYLYSNDNPYETVKWFLEMQQQYPDPDNTQNAEFNYKNNYIMTASYNQGLVGDVGVWLYNASIAGEPFRIQGKSFMPVTHESDFQGTHFIVGIE